MRRRSSNSVRVYYPEHSREELVALLRKRLAELSERLPIRLVILFGSYAKGRQTIASDIDLFVVVDGDKDQLYHEIHRSLNLSNLQLHLYTEDEHEKMKDSPFIREVEAGIRILDKDNKGLPS